LRSKTAIAVNIEIMPLERWEERGHNPIGRAMASPALTDEVRGQVRTAMRDRLTGSVAVELRERSSAEAELRGGAACGAGAGRVGQPRQRLPGGAGGASREQIEAVLGPLVAALASG
jgi:hypothetical protein